MAFEFGVWRIDNGFSQVPLQGMKEEKRLEDILYEHIEVLNKGWLVLGRQISTDHHGILDLLAIDKSGNLIVIELKRDLTPRDVVAQVLDYGAWVQGLDVNDIVRLYEKHKSAAAGESLETAFKNAFGINLPDDLNSSHQLVIVATELDAQTERIINYLSDVYDVDINVMFFRVIEDEGRQYLTRVWLLDSVEAQTKSDTRINKGEWNGEYYVSFGYDKQVVEDGLKHGYIVAGGGRWYSRTLELLSVGNRIWVNVPGHGYVGCGRVICEASPVDEFDVVTKQGATSPVREVSSIAASLKTAANNYDSADFLVGIEWEYQVGSLDKAKHEKGFFGNQNTVARPLAKSWDHTVNRLKILFGIKD